jgi:hypothetical protein
VLVAGVMLYSLIKGGAMRVHPYALSQYMYTFERGLLVRGLPGHLAYLKCGEDWECVGRFVDVTSTLALGFFALMVFLVVRAQSRSGAALLLLAIAASGPLLVSVASTRGYHDALTLGLGLLAYYCYLKARFVLALLTFGAALLVHEIVAIYTLPLFVLPALVRQSPRRWFARIAVLLSLMVATHTVVRQGAASTSQRRLLERKLKASAPELSDRWRGYRRYGPVAAKPTSTTPRPKRLQSLQRAYLRPYLLPIAVMVALATIVLIRRLRLLELPIYVGLMVAPLSVYLVAWDYNRLASLASLTALIVCVEVFRRFGGRDATLWLAIPALLLLWVQLPDPYTSLTKQYARRKTALRALHELVEEAN